MKLGRLRIKFMNKKSPINQFHLKQILETLDETLEKEEVFGTAAPIARK